MAILKDWIVEMAEGEQILGVVIGEMGWGDYGSDQVPVYTDQPRNKLLTWPEALPFISYEFDEGYGAPRCNSIVAWTESWVISVYQYDGSTGPFRLPRNPKDCEPEMPGGCE